MTRLGKLLVHNRAGLSSLSLSTQTTTVIKSFSRLKLSSTLFVIFALLLLVISFVLNSGEMSKSTKSKSIVDKKLEVEFCDITGASSRDARKYLDKYKRLDAAVDSYYNDPYEFSGSSKSSESDRISRLNAIFDKYKEDDGDEIGIDGTIALCSDLSVDPEDVVILAVAYELKPPAMGTWSRKGWVDGWRSLGQDTIEGMKASLIHLKQKLSSDPQYFKEVYEYTFNFALPQTGQRSLGLDQETGDARGYWRTLIPLGLEGGALSHVYGDEDENDAMEADEEGWRPEFTEWWIEFLEHSGTKGVSNDTWNMFRKFVREIDAKFEKYDETASWPSTLDEFVSWVRENKLS